MKFLCLIFLISFSTLSLAKEDPFQVYVNTFDDELDTSIIENPSIQITQGAGENYSEVAQLPPPDEMKKIFQKADLEKETSGFDQMEKDLFFMKVQRRDIASVQKSYKAIPSEKLEKLKKMIEVKK